MREINKLVVHCSATGPAMNIGVKEIDKWHRQRGFLPTATSLAVGYHKVIRRDGTVELGRPEERAGAHAAGHNANSLAVCLVGGCKEDNLTPQNNFTPAQFKTLKGVLDDWSKRFPGSEILGHRDLPNVAKECPCFDVRTWLASV